MAFKADDWFNICGICQFQSFFPNHIIIFASKIQGSWNALTVILTSQADNLSFFVFERYNGIRCTKINSYGLSHFAFLPSLNQIDCNWLLQIFTLLNALCTCHTIFHCAWFCCTDINAHILVIRSFCNSQILLLNAGICNRQ